MVSRPVCGVDWWGRDAIPLALTTIFVQWEKKKRKQIQVFWLFRPVSSLSARDFPWQPVRMANRMTSVGEVSGTPTFTKPLQVLLLGNSYGILSFIRCIYLKAFAWLNSGNIGSPVAYLLLLLLSSAEKHEARLVGWCSQCRWLGAKEACTSNILATLTAKNSQL